MQYPVPNLVYLSLPEPTEPVLNLQVNGALLRCNLTRDQLFQLNAQFADALVRGKIRPESRSPNQPELPFEETTMGGIDRAPHGWWKNSCGS